MATATKEKPAAKSAALKRTPTTASTAVAVRKPSNSSIVSIKDALKAQAEAVAGQTLPPSGSRIRATQDKQFILPTGEKTDTLELVILGFRTVHNFYEGAYDAKAITPPACFAVGQDPKNMVPSTNSPNKQADTCNECPMHEWGSDGDGKACKEGRLMACLPPDATEDSPIWLLQCSPTSNKGFDAYATSVVRAFQLPPIGVVTTVGFDESVTFARMQFGSPVPNKLLTEMYARQGEADTMLDAERDVSGYVAQPKKGASSAVRKPARR